MDLTTALILIFLIIMLSPIVLLITGIIAMQAFVRLVKLVTKIAIIAFWGVLYVGIHRIVWEYSFPLFVGLVGYEIYRFLIRNKILIFN